MDEKEKMPVAEAAGTEAKETEQAKPTGRAALRGRYAERYPDKNWDDDDAMADQAMADYDEMDGKLKAHEENDRKLTDLFEKNPQSASFLMGMANGEDFLSNLQRNFGEDIVEAMNNPEKLDELSKANKEYLDKVAKSKELQKNWETNMEGTLARLQQEQDASGMSDDEVGQAMDAMEKVVAEYLDGNISTETLQMFMKGKKHDADVEAARRNGEVNGRNANIEERLRKSRNESAGAPTLGGQGGSGKGRVMTRENRLGNVGGDIWAAGNFKRNEY